jgi:hypothetical protein
MVLVEQFKLELGFGIKAINNFGENMNSIVYNGFNACPSYCGILSYTLIRSFQ